MPSDVDQVLWCDTLRSQRQTVREYDMVKNMLGYVKICAHSLRGPAAQHSHNARFRSRATRRALLHEITQRLLTTCPLYR
jgi:hypothetical protein